MLNFKETILGLPYGYTSTSHRVRVCPGAGIIMLTYLPIIGCGHTILLVVSFLSECFPPQEGLELPLLAKDNPILISKFESL